MNAPNTATVGEDDLALLQQIDPKKRLVHRVAHALIEKGSMCSYDLGEALGCSKYSVNKAIRLLRDLGWVYISSWTHPAGSNALAPKYRWKGLEEKRDVYKPPRKPKSKINHDWNSRNKVYRSAMQRAKRGTIPNMWEGLIR